MNIRDVITQLIAYQGALAITAPASVTVQKAWPYFPPESVTPEATTPCFMNEWTLTRVEFAGASRLHRLYTVHSQLLVADMDNDTAADIATAFDQKVIDMLVAHQTMGGTCVAIGFRGGSPTLAALPRGGRTYIGLDMFIDVALEDAVAYGA